MLADCYWSVNFQAWVDADGNGVRDQGEEPLAGVRFRLSESFSAVSDSRGLGHVFLFPAGCEGMEYAVTALPPPGYQPTTDQPVKARGKGDVGTLSFGFRHVR
jgi:hypothetical protein